ncbi:MAG: hypothetical protein PHE84_01060 [bacterium]|nr:hypothetical protein [bacterium]
MKPEKVGQGFDIKAQVGFHLFRLDLGLFPHLELDHFFLALPDQADLRFLSHPGFRHHPDEILDILVVFAFDRAARELEDDVPRREPRPLGGRTAENRVHHHPAPRGNPEVFGQVAVQGLESHPDPAPVNLAGGEDLVPDLEHGVDRDGKTDPPPLHHRVDPDDLLVQVDQRSPAGAEINHGVGLEKVRDQGPVLHVSSPPADDPQGDRPVQAVGVADGQHPLPDLHLIGIPQLGHRHLTFRLDLDHGEIGLLVGAQNLGREFLLEIGNGHRHLHRLGNDMIVGDDVTLGIDNHPGTDHGDLAVFLLQNRLDMHHGGLHRLGNLGDHLLQGGEITLRVFRPGGKRRKNQEKPDPQKPDPFFHHST